MNEPLGYFEVVDWDKLQHYRDRRPLWIKTYNEDLDNYVYASLPDAQKGQLIGIRLLASLMDNRIPWDVHWVASKIHATSALDLDRLLRDGFIRRINHVPNPEQPDTDLFQSGSGSAIPEKRREEERRDREEGSAEGLRPPALAPLLEPPKVLGWIPVVGVKAADARDPDLLLRQVKEHDSSKMRWDRGVTEDKVLEWQEAYPGVKVKEQLRKMRQWAIDNPSKRKTVKGLNAAVSRWLAREQDDGGGKKTTGSGKAAGGNSAVDRARRGNDRFR